MVGPTRTWTQLAVTGEEEAADAAAFVVAAAATERQRKRERGSAREWHKKCLGSGSRFRAQANKQIGCECK